MHGTQRPVCLVQSVRAEDRHVLVSAIKPAIGKVEPQFAPLAEQRRIVAKVDELMAVLDALEAALTTAGKLLAATVAKLHAT